MTLPDPKDREAMLTALNAKWIVGTLTPDAVLRLVAEAVERERSECAKECRKVANSTRGPSGQSASVLARLSAIAEGSYRCEEAIRARRTA